MADKRTTRDKRPARIALTVKGLTSSRSETPLVRAPAMPWALASVVGGVGCALAGWLLVAAPVVTATLSGPARPLSGGFALGTQLWLLAHGAGAAIGGTTITLVPLGLTLLFALMVVGVSGSAARQAQLLYPDDNLTNEDRRRWTGLIVGTFSGSYVIAVGLTAFLTTNPAQMARALAGATVLSVAGSFFGASRTLRWRPTQSWPVWVRRVPRAAAAGVLVILVGGSVALVTSLYVSRGRIADLTNALAPDTVGSVVLALGQLAFLPNLVIWAASWVLGAGVSLGDGSITAPTGTQVGLLPSIPVFGAVPDAGSGWSLAGWLAVGVAAGVVAAWASIAPRRRARFDESALVGGLAGVATGILMSAVAALSRGDLGTSRLVDLGPRAVPLFVIGCSLMGLSGVVTGTVMGLVAWTRVQPVASAGSAVPETSLPRPTEQGTDAAVPAPEEAVPETEEAVPEAESDTVLVTRNGPGTADSALEPDEQDD